ncbi:MAG: tRNA 2-selenouridine(34) synthase MnmH [Rhodothermales bacterium]|nr:tRNA 2-selenouridine(34) synthase MnmH [Rhodothermales bacterium]
MPASLDAAAFVRQSRHRPVLDVRTPAEYAQGHLPGAHNLPLFEDAERAEIGTLYKQAGRRAAMLRALDLVGPKLRALTERADAWAGGGDVLVHCWRGGMRSASVAWLLEFFGHRAETLQGGYKAFRRLVLGSFALERPVCLLGGMTGAGKTEVLDALAMQGAQVLDLEALANHQGSVFGHLGRPAQPTQEQFENELAVRWRALDPARPVWIEDESRRLGRVVVPAALWAQMRAARVLLLDVPFEDRVRRLVDGYGRHEAARLAEAIGCIGKRLGGLRTRQAQQAVHGGDLEGACRILLAYYDGAYRHALDRRGAVCRPVAAPPGAGAAAIAAHLIAAAAPAPSPAPIA